MKKYILFLSRHKKIIVPALYLIILVFGVFIFNFIIVDHIEGYTLSFNDRELALVNRESLIYSMLNNLEQEIENKNKVDIIFDYELLGFRKTENTLDSFTTISNLKQKLKDNVTYKCKCWAIAVDGKNVVFLKNKEQAEEVIERIGSEENAWQAINVIQDPLNTKSRWDVDIKLADVILLENVEICPALEYPQNIWDPEQSYKYLLAGELEEQTYKVESGDSFLSISYKHNIDVSQIIEANPKVNSRLIRPGDLLRLNLPKPFVNVEISYKNTFNKVIPPPLIVKRDANIYRTRVVVEKPGENGEKQLVREVVLLNGMVKENRIVSEEVLFPPKVRVLVKGTKRTPDDVLMQKACLPEGKGLITSYFGVWRRWGYHTGVDVTVPMGTNVLAYKDGTVIRSEWNLWGYGYFVIIDHDNGIHTCYGHNSKLLVEKGQKVKKGQVIALSGNTGTSTGPHVHFEVRKNGKPIDPIPFLKNGK